MMSGQDYGPQLEMKSLLVDFDAFMNDLTRKLTDLGIEQKSVRPALKSFEQFEKKMRSEFLPLEKDGMLPYDVVVPKLQKHVTNLCGAICIEGVKGMEGINSKTPDKVKVSAGSEFISAEIDFGWDEKKQRLKSGRGVKIKFKFPKKKKK